MRWIASIFVSVSFLFCLAENAEAQTKVAIVDIGLVFKNHPDFSNQLEALSRQAEQFKAQTQQLQQSFQQKVDVLNQYEKDSADYREKEAELAKESATMEVNQRSKMRELLTEEARLHFDTYVEVSNFISQYCQENGIQLVLRYNSEEMDPKDPESIMQRVNGSVIYHHAGNDITNVITQRIIQANHSVSQSTDKINR